MLLKLLKLYMFCFASITNGAQKGMSLPVAEGSCFTLSLLIESEIQMIVTALNVS